MNKFQNAVLQAHFKRMDLVKHNINSFDELMRNGLQRVVTEVKNLKPNIIPPGLESFEIKFGSIWVKQPVFKEADGSHTKILPVEARIRDLTYEAPVFLEMTRVENGIEKEKENIYIGNLPIMIKSKNCYLQGKSIRELVKFGEDPDDPGGYFIINGTERVVVIVEDLAPNKILVEAGKHGPYPHIAKTFSEDGQYRIPHLLEKAKDGIVYVTFTRVQRIPFVILIKALGILKDKRIVDLVSSEDKFMFDLYINLDEAKEINTQDEALDYIGRRLGLLLQKRKRVERVREVIDRFLFPHIGHSYKDRLNKAHFLCKAVKKLLMVSYKMLKGDDKDHYSNKRLRLCGDLMENLFRFVFRMLLSDIKYNFERLVKRGKTPDLQGITRSQLLTSRVRSALATGEWIGERHGVAQHLARLNYLDTLSHLRRIVSLLTSSRENFEARDLHPTHWGKLCSSETPEGQPIGLRKNLAFTCTVSPRFYQEKKLITEFKKQGLKVI